MVKLALSEPCARSRTQDARFKISLAADRFFDKYKKEKPQEVRRLKMHGTEPDRLRARRQMLREMTPEQAIQVMHRYIVTTFGSGLTFFEALALAKREGKLIVPIDVHDRILTEIEDEALIKRLYSASGWTGTLIIYEKQGEPFGNKVFFSWQDDNVYSISFIVPKQFLGRLDCALILDHPDFELINLGSNNYQIMAADEHIHLLENFPREPYQPYLYDERFRIPIGEKQKIHDDTVRHLWRLHASYIGPIARFARVVWGDVLAGRDWTRRSDVALF